ncbi:hypothetical protein I316_06920 [Kwoniella heveanensis BCC8398]|uniref:Uncharacterized protein n=1 Tax=Kwoniella heveanensis BCC8398 TaxID=1296120 RepID=A0A1B9GKK1_9TREE|nr:hypothetical protein I316_06920 [Kwoniella heveanensis BCC8398]
MAGDNPDDDKRTSLTSSAANTNVSHTPSASFINRALSTAGSFLQKSGLSQNMIRSGFGDPLEGELPISDPGQSGAASSHAETTATAGSTNPGSGDGGVQ